MSDLVWSEKYETEPVPGELMFFRISVRAPDGHTVTFPAIYGEMAAKYEFTELKLSYANTPGYDNWKLQRFQSIFRIHTYTGEL